MKAFIFLTFLSLTSIGCVSAPSVRVKSLLAICQQDGPRLAARSKELQEIVAADQAERAEWQSKTPEQMIEVLARDEVRRKRVGEIFGEGCFSKAEDYAAAALVFQHGNTPDHFFQTFIWSKRAVDLGDAKQKRMVTLAIDRYLVNVGHKQLFGSQADRPGPTAETCWCLSQIESAFPDERRKDEFGRTLSQAFDWLKDLNGGKNCPNTECSAALNPSPKGTVPGYW